MRLPEKEVFRMEEVNHVKRLGFPIKRLLFILILLGVFVFANNNNLLKNPFNTPEVASAPTDFSDLLAKMFNLSIKKDEEPAILRQELIQEESAVISVVEKASASVVSVVVRRVSFDPFSGPFTAEDSIGTGFIVDAGGLIITNSHVVNDPEGEYSVILNDGSTYEVLDVNLDEGTDLAILEIEATGLPEIALGDSDVLKVGQTAIAIGNALGRFSNTVTVGVVSGVARELTAYGGRGELKTYEGVIQTDAALNPGNSGGPLLNSSGQVIGINVATTSGADNIGFAIPVNTLRPILSGFLVEGRIIRPYIGVTYSLISSSMAELRDLPEGAFVSRVLPESPAAKAGIEAGDIVTKFGDTEIKDEVVLSDLVRQYEVGDSVPVTVVRKSEKVNLTVVLEEAPDSIL